MKHSNWIVAAAIAASATGSTWAAVSAAEAKQLGASLTPWGSEVAGNADGSIPAYSGGVQSPPSGANPASGKWPNPFGTDKPLFSVSAANMAQYGDKVTPGLQELMKRWSTFKINVYPSRRSVPAMSKERADATLKNALNPACRLEGNGVGLRGCWGGVPFPIPKSGYEAMWNSIVGMPGSPALEISAESWIVDGSGHATMSNYGNSVIIFPLWDAAVTPYKGEGEYYRKLLNTTYEPARDAGQKTLLLYPAEFDTKEQRAYLYTTGQRRTRLAPEFAYDTPTASLGGALNYDEIGMFSGRMDRFDFKIVGKREMFVRYNSFDEFGVAAEKLLGPKHVNPDSVRYELHRVWVVEATLKSGARHVASKRMFYLDEDSWGIVASDGYDQAGKIYRVSLAPTLPDYFSKQGIVNGAGQHYYDLTKGQYLVASLISPRGTLKNIPRPSASSMTPEAMAGAGVR